MRATDYTAAEASKPPVLGAKTSLEAGLFGTLSLYVSGPLTAQLRGRIK